MTVTANPNKALWEKGDFTQVAEAMRASGETLVARLGITPGTRVLDLPFDPSGVRPFAPPLELP